MTSIRTRIMIYFASLIVIISIIFSIGVNHFMDDYYYGKKIETMNGVISDINKLYAISRSEDEALARIDYLGYTFEGKIRILDAGSNMVIYENKRFQFTEGIIRDEITYHDNTAYVYETEYPVEGARWLIYMERLDNNKVALLQIPVVAIDEAIVLMKTFMNILILMAIGAAVVMAIVLSRSLTKPILKLHHVVKSIGNLDFHERYNGDRKDEIGELGRGLNTISDTLQGTIRDLEIKLQKEKQLDQLRRRFVAQVSHELQTPISIISSYVEALDDGIVEGDEVVEYYHVISDESDKMSRIIKDLLQLSQMEANTFSYNMDSFSLMPFIHKILTRYETMCQHAGLRMEIVDEVNHEQGFYGDTLRLEQGITNILSNAMKHSDQFIKVFLTEGEDFIMLRILNSGDAIPEDDLPHIFDSFYKGKTGRSKAGTGLGLAIASHIFERHNMDVRVENKDEGVCFIVTFPKFRRDDL